MSPDCQQTGTRVAVAVGSCQFHVSRSPVQIVAIVKYVPVIPQYSEGVALVEVSGQRYRKRQRNQVAREPDFPAEHENGM